MHTTNVTHVLNKDKLRLSAEESLPEPTSGSARQQCWRLELDRLADDDMEGLEAFLEAFTSAAVEGQGQNAPNAPQNGPSGSRRNPQHYRPPRPNRPEYDPLEAARIQKLYCSNRRKAMNHLLRGKSPPCPLDERTIINHLESSSSGPPTTDGSALIEQNPVDEECAEWLLRTVGPAEVSRRLLRMSNTAPGPDKVRFNDLKRIDPGCYTLSMLYTRCMRMRKVP